MLFLPFSSVFYLSREMGEDLKELQNLGFQIQSIESMQLFVSPFQAASWPDGSFVFFFRRAGGSVDRTESHSPSLLAALLLAPRHFPQFTARGKAKEKNLF
jgi:hypothetical protein